MPPPRPIAIPSDCPGPSACPHVVDHVDPTLAAVLELLRRQMADASKERREATEATVHAIEGLGKELRGEIRSSMRWSSITILVALLLLGSVAGGAAYFRGYGLALGTGEHPTHAEVAPAPEVGSTP